MKNKKGLYATYCKTTGSFIKSSIKTRSQAYMSSKQSSLFIHELLTEDEYYMYNFPKEDISKHALTLDNDSFIMFSSESHKCDLCGDYFGIDDMHFIPDEEDLRDRPGLCSQCNNCTQE